MSCQMLSTQPVMKVWHIFKLWCFTIQKDQKNTHEYSKTHSTSHAFHQPSTHAIIQQIDSCLPNQSSNHPPVHPTTQSPVSKLIIPTQRFHLPIHKPSHPFTQLSIYASIHQPTIEWLKQLKTARKRTRTSTTCSSCSS